jgi:lipopolysaccharide transport system ATP-binding protein
MDTAIEFARVGKRYLVRHQRPFLMRELVRSVLQRPSAQHEHWALRDVSFTVGRGESVAVIGTNGAGKSTLLSLIAQTSAPTAGTVTVRGRIGPLLELGAGFHPDLSGLENVYLNASLLGLTRRQVDERLGSIVDYSGIAEFIDAPIQTYSSGMKARLGFAVIAHIEPEILLLDEVLVVGDGQFTQKCEATIREFKRRGVTLFLVSHGIDQVLSMCERVIWLHQGRLLEVGPAAEVCARYQRFLATGGNG